MKTDMFELREMKCMMSLAANVLLYCNWIIEIELLFTVGFDREEIDNIDWSKLK